MLSPISHRPKIFLLSRSNQGFLRILVILARGQLLGIEPKAVEPQSTILPLNYSCRRVGVKRQKNIRTRYRTRTDTPKEWLLRPPCLPFHQAGGVPWGRLELPKT